MRTLFKLAALGFLPLLPGLLINALIPEGVRWPVLQASIPWYRPKTEIQSVSADAAFEMSMNRDIRFVDVRSFKEYCLDHIENSLSLPMDTIFFRIRHLPFQNDTTPVIIYGFEPNEPDADLAGRLLSGQGFSSLYILQGGMSEWLDYGFPVSEGL